MEPEYEGLGRQNDDGCFQGIHQDTGVVRISRSMCNAKEDWKGRMDGMLTNSRV